MWLYTHTHTDNLENNKNKICERDIYANASTAITLIALIITIIVLLILAGVTLNMVIRENGIFSKANWASFTTEYSQVKEETELYTANIKLENYNKNFKNLQEKYPIKGNEITDIKGSLKKTIIGFENINDISEAKIYEIDMKKIGSNVKNEYVINIETGKVYRKKGFVYNGNTYHIPELKIQGNGEEIEPIIKEYKVTQDYHFVETEGAKAQVDFTVELPEKIKDAQVEVNVVNKSNGIVEGTYNEQTHIYTGTITTDKTNSPNGTYIYEIKAKKDNNEYSAEKAVEISKFLEKPEIEILDLKFNQLKIHVKNNYPEESGIKYKYYIAKSSENYTSQDLTSELTIEKTNLTAQTKYKIKVEAYIGNEKSSTEITQTTPEKIVEINYWEEFLEIQSDLTGKYTIEKDLDFYSKESWKTEENFNKYTADTNSDGYPDVPFSISQTDGKCFSGTLDGKGHTLKNYTLYNTNTDIYYAGLIGNIGDNCIIKNLLMKDINVKINNSQFGGSLIGKTLNNFSLEKIGCTGKIYLTKKGYSAGGIIGSIGIGVTSKQELKNCYSRVKITDERGYDIGGIIGDCYTSSYHLKCKFTNCYFAESIVNTNNVTINRLGTFAGGGTAGNNDNMHGDASLTNCYYNKELFTYKVSPSGTGLTTKEMKDKSKYTGWDFKENEEDKEYTWYIDENVNDGYPELNF